MKETRVTIFIFGVSLILALLHSAHGEFRYKIRAPPPPPLPPKPPLLLSKPPHPYYSKTKYQLSTGPRIISSHLRGPPVKHYLDHSPYHYHPSPALHMLNKPVIHSSSAVHKSPPKIILTTGFKEPFRLPITLKESFPPVQSVTVEYNAPSKSAFIPSTISPHNFPSVLLNDEEKGPIHTIPAPNLSPADKPLASSVPSSVLSNHLDTTSLTAHNIYSQNIPALTLNAFHLEPPISVPYAVNAQHSGGYQVHENTNDHTGHDLEGKPVYYAPDPDPSIPAPRVPPTSDPHSHPSNGKSKEELLFTHAHAQSVPPQIFETQTDVNSPSNSLTSQDLFHILQSNVQEQQQLLDNYGLPVMAQPHFQQHFIHHVPAIPVYHQPAALDNSLAFKQNFQSPQYHSFNYQEKGSSSELSGSQHYSSPLLNNFHDVDNGDEEEAESAPIPAFVKHLPQPISGYQNQQNYKSDTDTSNQVTNEQQKKSVPESFFSQVAQSTQLYSTLPNREAAETLASLQAAGNINSNFVSKINEVKSEPQNSQSSEQASDDDEYSDEDADEEYDDNQTQVTQNPQYYQLSTASSVSADIYAQTHLKNTSRNTEKHNNDQEDESREQDGTEYSGTEQQFGARIRPK